MHSTHQFFLTERSLYLLLVSGREGRHEEDAEYWLKTIRGFGGDSPILIVLNKQGEHPFDLNRSALQQKYPQIAGFASTDCASGQGIEELHRLIRREDLDRLEGGGRSFPPTGSASRSASRGWRKTT